MNSQAVNKSRESEERSPAEFAVLGIVVHRNAHGYDVYRELESRLGSVHRLGRSQVYGLLSRLERDGLIKHEHVEQERVPDKKVFSPTAEGRSLLDRWILTPVNNVRSLSVEFLTKLYFAGLKSRRTELELLQAQIAAYRKRSEFLEKTFGTSLNLIERRACEFRLSMVRCSITWLENMAAEAETAAVDLPEKTGT